MNKRALETSRLVKLPKIAGLGTVRTARRKAAEPSPLAVVTVRLLAIAIELSRRPTRRVISNAIALPAAYRNWPCIRTTAEGVPRTTTFACYICPKGFSALPHEEFQTGTRFIMETYRVAPDGDRRSARPKSPDAAPDTVFVMEKYADVSVPGSAGQNRQLWAHATYAADGGLLASAVRQCCPLGQLAEGQTPRTGAAVFSAVS
ncbi:MAG: hypothetical protein FJ248_05230 [Nitrospira sp.]|nr:hypothetical protein [Nitrospira sp.]